MRACGRGSISSRRAKFVHVDSQPASQPVMSSDSESAPCCSSTLSSEHELTESASGGGLPMRKKRKVASGPGVKIYNLFVLLIWPVFKILKFD